MKFYLQDFRSNNPDLELEDVITEMKAGTDSLGISHIQIHTKDKYVRIGTNALVFYPNYNATLIIIKPLLYNKEGDNLYDKDWDAYYQHPDWYSLEIAVDFGKGVHPVMHTTALKYEYYIQAIPHNLAFNYDVLEEIDLIVLDEEE